MRPGNRKTKVDRRVTTATVVGLVAAAMLSVGQDRVEFKSPAGQPNTWEKTKRCADQAERVMAAKTRELPSI